jgi:hypothetical protein
MEEDELRREFIRVDSDTRGRRISVCTIEWPGPGTPVSTWLTVWELSPDSTDSAVKLEIDGLIRVSEYFAVCVECGQRMPRGWMHDDRICQPCAERNHGVVY